jgi:NAD(P)-dependent dehydrogenase (short-subunit alcohol dehydrogenase family)
MEKQYWLISGASQGIGAALVKELSKNAENVVLGFGRNAQKIQDLSMRLKNSPAQLDLFQADIVQDLDKIAEKITQLPYLSVLINNAAAFLHKPFLETSPKDWQDLFATNVFASVALIQKSLTQLEKNPKKAQVLNITSMGGFQGSVKFAGLSAYSASKACLANITECLAAEYSTSNIAFNALALGAVQTEMLSQAFPDYKAPINPTEIAEFIVQFAEKNGQLFNGKILPVSSSTP